MNAKPHEFSEIIQLDNDSLQLIPFEYYNFDSQAVRILNSISNEYDIRILAGKNIKKITIQDTRNFISEALAGRDDDEVFYYILENKEPLGVFGLIQKNDNRFETGFWISREHRGCGKHALRALLNHWPGYQFEAKTASSNTAAIKILEYNGFRIVKNKSGMIHFFKDFNNSTPQ